MVEWLLRDRVRAFSEWPASPSVARIHTPELEREARNLLETLASRDFTIGGEYKFWIKDMAELHVITALLRAEWVVSRNKDRLLVVANLGAGQVALVELFAFKNEPPAAVRQTGLGPWTFDGGDIVMRYNFWRNGALDGSVLRGRQDREAAED